MYCPSVQPSLFQKLTRYFMASVFTFILGFIAFTPVVIVHAAPLTSGDLGLQTTGDVTGLTNQPVQAYIGRGIQIALSMLGVVFLILIIYAGFHWMLAQGNSTEIAKARAMILQGVIGLGVILGAYAATSFVIQQLTQQ